MTYFNFMEETDLRLTYPTVRLDLEQSARMPASAFEARALTKFDWDLFGVRTAWRKEPKGRLTHRSFALYISRILGPRLH